MHWLLFVLAQLETVLVRDVAALIRPHLFSLWLKARVENACRHRGWYTKWNTLVFSQWHWEHGAEVPRFAPMHPYYLSSALRRQWRGGFPVTCMGGDLWVPLYFLDDGFVRDHSYSVMQRMVEQWTGVFGLTLCVLLIALAWCLVDAMARVSE